MLHRLLQAAALGRNGFLAGSPPTATSAATAIWPRVLSRFYAASGPHPSENILSGTGTAYAEGMYAEYQRDPSSVNASWRTFFDNLDKDVPPGQAFSSAPGVSSLSGSAPSIQGRGHQADTDALKVAKLIRAYQMRAHHIANLDPLGINAPDLDIAIPELLNPEFYELTPEDMKRDFVLSPSPLFPGTESNPMILTMEAIINRLKECYCGTIGFEYMFIDDLKALRWCRDRIEVFTPPSAELKQECLKGLIRGARWEHFLAKKFVSEKRFGIDGCETLIPGMQFMLKRAVELGVERAVIGMPHRGRLNVLTNIMEKPMEIIFKEFTSQLAPEDEGSGDVKYHLGMTSDIKYPSGKTLHMSLLANPSHLEAVNPVLQGKARATQLYLDDTERTRVLPVTLHGDAAFAGQGVVYETLGMSSLSAYTTGGTIHIVVNNQIGFTTDPRFARSSAYCTDLAKMIGAPIMHVNGDDPEAVLRCFDIAIEWRQKFHKDVVIDVVCYRRYGHNESDQPAFTQPRMYQHIAQMENVSEAYARKLTNEGVVTAEWVKKETDEYDARVDQALQDAPTFVQDVPEDPSSWWQSLKGKVDQARISSTGVERTVLKRLGEKLLDLPEDLVVHGGVKRVLKSRAKALKSGEGIDWGTGEHLALASLLTEGTHVRLSGQDVERGTFSHRHAVLHDQETDGKTHTPLEHLAPDQKVFSVSNSHLSEYGVLGFELGYSQVHPWSLVMWEAQFGDFSNTAQCIIDQFITSMEEKWRRQTGLVMLLPHGFEGMGPEHSSCRLERFLQMCAEPEHIYPEAEAMAQIEQANLQVVNCTTPANYFHVLRRQVYREFRKPLVVATPKSLLRHPRAVSSMADFEEGTRFERFLPEVDAEIADNPDSVTRVVLCSGKVYYDLEKIREAGGLKNVAIGRVEQLSPFPFDLVTRFVDGYKNAEIVWCQEEPRNMGPWSYVCPRIETALTKSEHHPVGRPTYAGRESSASVATGDKRIHYQQAAVFVSEALGLDFDFCHENLKPADL